MLLYLLLFWQKFRFMTFVLKSSTETNFIKSSSSDSRVRWFEHTKVTGSNTVSITDHCKRSEWVLELGKQSYWYTDNGYGAIL